MKKDNEYKLMRWDSLNFIQLLNDYALAARLRLAIKSYSLRLYYLPVIDVQTRTTVEAEALIRWPQKNDNYIPPLAFLPVAQAHGLMPKLTRWIIGTALRDLSLWRNEGVDIGITINLFPSELDDEGIIPFISDELARYQLPADKLGFEMAQRHVSVLSDAQQKKIEQLHAMGVRLIMDNVVDIDLETHAGHLRVWKTLKIDWQLIMKMTNDARLRHEVSHFIREATRHDVKVVLPGVHTYQEWACIRKKSGLLAQGFYVTPPQSWRDLEIWFRLSHWKPAVVSEPSRVEKDSMLAGEAS